MVLAAGTGSRFGATKQLEPVDGRPMVAHVVAAALAATDEVVVVVGHDADEVAAAAVAMGPVTVVRNSRYAEGQATSLVAGLDAAAATDAEVAVVLLGDEPDVSPAAISAVTAAIGGEVVVTRARYDDGDGHPVAFARPVWDRIDVAGDQGARDLLAALDVVAVPVGGPRPRDVDTREDLDRRRRG